MSAYNGSFVGQDQLDWQPYVMHYHPRNFQSDVVSTDSSGFRYTVARNARYSATTLDRSRPVRLLVGSSTVFGIGASSDAHTLTARLTANDGRPELWVNFGGRAFNSAQELLLFILNRHALPPIAEIVLFSGFNDLALARLPAKLRGDHGGFFFCRRFFDALAGRKPSRISRWFGPPSRPDPPDDVLGHDEQVSYAADLVTRHLQTWKILADAAGAELTYVLQPLADWVRATGCEEERRIFAELEHSSAFGEAYRDIRSAAAHRAYAEALRAGADGAGVRFVDFTSLLSGAAAPDQWLFVDRIHFTDGGNDLAAMLLLNQISRERSR